VVPDWLVTALGASRCAEDDELGDPLADDTADDGAGASPHTSQ
jgi:hypothetical protein